MSAQVIHAVEVTQHSCFCYEDEDICITIYSKRKKRMRRYELYTILDIAKAELMEKIRGR